MELLFPPLSGGTVSGLNDAGIETFEGDFARNVVRECGQNSLDAAANPEQPVSLKVGWFRLERNFIPFLPALENVLKACHDYWDEHEKARRFFSAAMALAAQQDIYALKISDFGTTGVDGDDNERTGRWFGLVKSRGVSNQRDTESGGAFGIGKDAPLAGSGFRTVLYSTKTLDGCVAFQGVCRLVTHENQNGETQGTGFIGDFDPVQKEYRAIRDSNLIPKQFLRTEPGLDVWIIGWRHDDLFWPQPFIRSALANFWPAIAKGKITFEIGDQSIDRANLGQAMRAERFDPEVGDAWPFYLSLVDQHAKEFQKILPNAGQCRLHLLLARRDLPKKVCMVRRTGMVIEQYAPRVSFLPFSGLFVCEGVEGNRLLRTLEPPRHDEWDSARAEDPRASSALKEIKEWVRDEVRKQTPHSDEDQFNESEVPPDLLEDVPENPITDDTSQDQEPDLGGNPKEAAPHEEVKVRTRAMRKNQDSGQIGTTDLGDDVEDPKNGDGKNTGGRKGRKGEGVGDSTVIPKVPALRTRAFLPSDGNGCFEVILRCEGDYQGSVWLEALGDDGSAENVAIDSVEIIGVGPAEVEQSKIKNLKLTADDVVRLRVRLKSRGKYALRGALT